jgi:nitrite reductase/ring-hydroxylating ferredoxin subunit
MTDELSGPIRIPRPLGLEENGIAVAVADGADVVILQQDGRYRGVERWCPHEDGDLGEGMMYGKNIKCPVHGYIFDLEKGQCLNQFMLKITVYDVQVDGDDLLLTAKSQRSSGQF